jgi:hypothetical protein
VSGKVLLRANLIVLIGYAIGLVIVGLLPLYQIVSGYGLYSLKEVFSTIMGIVPFVLITLLWTSVIWIPVLGVLWVMDGIFFVAFDCQIPLAMAIEWLFLCVPLLFLLLDNYTADEIQRWMLYPYLNVVMAFSLFFKGRYFSALKKG